MSLTDADLDRSVRSWLDEGITSLPDRVLDAVLDELPGVRQRTRPWTSLADVLRGRLGLVAALLVLFVALAGFLLTGPHIGDDSSPEASWRAFPLVEQPLDAGGYLIADPFPVRIGITMPPGWSAGPLRSTLAHVGTVGETYGAGLAFTVIQGVYADPCHQEVGLVDPPIGPTVDDLAAAIAGLPNVAVSRPSETTVDGYRAVTLTLTAPASLEACTGEHPLFKIWGVPEWHWLDANERNRIWIVQAGETRLVVSAEQYEATSAERVAQLDAIIASIDIEPASTMVVRDRSPTPSSSFVPLPDDGPIAAGSYEFGVRLHRYGTAGVAIPLTASHRVSLTTPDGWSTADAGVEKDPSAGPLGPSVSAWSIGRVYIDPCHWQTSAHGIVDPPMMRRLDRLAEAFSGWWAVEPAMGPEYEAPPSAPRSTSPIDQPRYGQFAKLVELTLPSDLDLASCDQGEYRLWEDLDGRARIARGASERIRVWVVDFDPGLLVVEASSFPDTSAADASELEQILASMWVNPPVDAE